MPATPILGNYAELHQQDWLAVDLTVAHWLACRAGQNAAATAKARQQASEAVTRAMLHDAMGIVCKTVDNRKPISERRPAAPMAQSLIQSIFSHHNFTILIQSHQNARTVNLRTWLTRHIHWKLGERFKHEKAVRQLVGECGFTTEYDDAALQHQVAAKQLDTDAYDDAEAAYQIKQGWQHFENVLSKIEQQVLLLFWNGESDAQASRQLGIKVGAYSGHRERALQKLRMEYPAK
jgi:DNA-directed RNA polymerase specialized sigma24 family protein